MSVVERVREAVERRRWTLVELAKRTDVKYRTLQGWLQRAEVPGDWLAKVATALGVDPGWLLTGDGGMEPREGVVVLPREETLEELRDWLDQVLPTSPASNGDRPTYEQMAEWLRERRWKVVPPPDWGEGEGARGGG